MLCFTRTLVLGSITFGLGRKLIPLGYNNELRLAAFLKYCFYIIVQWHCLSLKVGEYRGSPGIILQ